MSPKEYTLRSSNPRKLLHKYFFLFIQQEYVFGTTLDYHEGHSLNSCISMARLSISILFNISLFTLYNLIFQNSFTFVSRNRKMGFSLLVAWLLRSEFILRSHLILRNQKLFPRAFITSTGMEWIYSFIASTGMEWISEK